MNSSIEVLIENYNIKSNEYQFGRQELIKISMEELKDILNSLPEYNKEKIISIRIITKSLILYKLDNEKGAYQYNYSFSLFSTTNYLFRIYEIIPFKLEDVDKVFQKVNLSKFKSLLKTIGKVFDLIWIVIPILNLINLISFIVIAIDFDNFNSNILFFYIWLVLFCIYSIFYSIQKLIKMRKKFQKIKIDYSFPFINTFETLDASEIVIILGQYFILGFNSLSGSNFNLFDYLFYFIVLPFILLTTLNDFNKYYKHNKRIKEAYLEVIYHKMQEVKDLILKNYYLQISIHLKSKPLISIEKIPKFFTFLSIFITFIPIISYFIVLG